MKKRDNKDRWKIILGIVIWIIIVVLVVASKISVNDKIQACSVITLIFITVFYAVQTQRLVAEERRSLEETKKLRRAEYGEKRIGLCLKPLFDAMNDLLVALWRIVEWEKISTEVDYSDELKEAKVALRQAQEIYDEKQFMLSSLLAEGVDSYLDKIEKSWPKQERAKRLGILGPWATEIIKDTERVQKLIQSESSEIAMNIRKTYGHYSTNADG